MTWKPAARCTVPGCRRTPSRADQAICGACWRRVPVETKLALEGHNDAWKRPSFWIGLTWTASERAAWNAFVGHSWDETMRLGVRQAAGRRLGLEEMLDLAELEDTLR